MLDVKKQLRDFADRWSGKGYEKGDTQKFWLELLQLINYQHTSEVLFEHRVAGGGFVDVWLRDAGVLVEQKSLGVDLDKAEMRQGVSKTPLQQALNYAENLPLTEQPRFLVTCNFQTFRVYDRNLAGSSNLASSVFEFELAQLPAHPEYLRFILDPQNSRLEREKLVSIQAGKLIGQLYELLRTSYTDPDSPASMHSLNVLCVRLVFCLYCEDADLFIKDAFYDYLNRVPASSVRTHLLRLFKTLNTPLNERDAYDTDLSHFPYVNGGLFRDVIEVPNFSVAAQEFLLEQMSRQINWANISPTIFGGIFESTLNPETRRSGGMHYTSPANIHRVIDPLFFDELRAEFAAIRDDAGQTPRMLRNRLQKFHQRLCSLKFFDPACGSGNFLTETYLSLRKLEDEVLVQLHKGQVGFSFSSDETAGKRVSLNQFYGIEINDFAVAVAETALLISRLKANGETAMLTDFESKDFPLVERPHILCANALRTDWHRVLPAAECDFIIGNPPFKGQYGKSADQTADAKLVWGSDYDGYLHYVTCWFKKAADYFQNTRHGRFAFVSTNSIAQGQPVPALFGPLFRDGWRIRFAHQTFPWASESSDAAAVHCVITGYDKREPAPATIYSYAADETEPLAATVSNINGYLIEGSNLFANKRTKLLSAALSEVTRGSQPTDGGFLIVEPEVYAKFAADPITSKYLRRFVGARELIQGKERWCLWMADADFDPQDIYRSALLQARVEACGK